MNHVVKWKSPSPYWRSELSNNATKFNTPKILEFTSDNFMDELLNALNTVPEKNNGTQQTKVTNRLRAFQPKKVDWRGNKLDPEMLKLYQPAHQRHYLVSASLVCERPGLPDRLVAVNRQESVGFVMRRLISIDGQNATIPQNEFALVQQDGDYVWKKVTDTNDAQFLVEGEEILPMFPLGFKRCNKQNRRIFAGTIPVSRCEIYDNTPLPPDQAEAFTGKPADSKASRLTAFQIDVTGPWENLIDLANSGAQLVVEEAFPTGDSWPGGYEEKRLGKIANIREMREQIYTASQFILIDFAAFLEKFIPDVYKKIKNSTHSLPDTGKQNLYNTLGAIKCKPYSVLKDTTLPPIASNLRSALYTVIVNPTNPGIIFPFADPGLDITPDPSTYDSNTLQKNYTAYNSTDLLTAIKDALDETPAEDVAIPQRQLAARIADQGKIDENGGTYYVRCVYRRPQCHPWRRDEVSRPTEPFQLAGFFDPDAPARPIRVTLPADPTPAGLRKYAKNSAFLMSAKMCGFGAALKKITFGDLVLSVLPWPFHKSLKSKVGNIEDCSGSGRVCSLSIPVVTICAMFLLIMIVSILNFIFKWMPWFICCFSLPKFRKENSD
ncbi:MAG: hypothetical protein DWQ10_17205 [Calditrichaeota bacterium]|nr:MAG: hypothetical protein DWQ10_17205 [Calditrichota bacterium]